MTAAEQRDAAGTLIALGGLECVSCHRNLTGLLVRLATGICTLCEHGGDDD